MGARFARGEMGRASRGGDGGALCAPGDGIRGWARALRAGRWGALRAREMGRASRAGDGARFARGRWGALRAREMGGSRLLRSRSLVIGRWSLVWVVMPLARTSPATRRCGGVASAGWDRGA